MSSVSQALGVALGQEGYSRWDDPQAGSKYGRWYAAHTGSPYFGTNGVPFCAMFVSWVLANAGTSLLGDGAVYAYVPWMIRDARKHGRLVGWSDIQPGDVLCFDWNHDGIADHTGFATTRPSNGWVRTIEGNTSTGAGGSQSNGGRVAQRVRARSTVVAVIRPPYGSGAAPAAPAASGKLEVDGVFGPATIRAVQAALGTPVDGAVSSQPWACREHVPAAGEGWVWAGRPTGSTMVRALQHACGVEADGFCGPATVKAWQYWLGQLPDGYFGPATTRQLQTCLNDYGVPWFTRKQLEFIGLA